MGQVLIKFAPRKKRSWSGLDMMLSSESRQTGARPDQYIRIKTSLMIRKVAVLRRLDCHQTDEGNGLR